MKQTTDYQICDYGLEHASYFQGHGTSFTPYTYASLGCGDTYAEALEDALEQAAMDDTEITLLPEDQPQNWEGKGPSASETDDSEDSELYYYVGLRWN